MIFNNEDNSHDSMLHRDIIKLLSFALVERQKLQTVPLNFTIHLNVAFLFSFKIPKILTMAKNKYKYACAVMLVCVSYPKTRHE